MRNQPAVPPVGKLARQAPEQRGQAHEGSKGYGLQEEDSKTDPRCQEQEQDKAEDNGQEEEQNDDD